MSSPMKTDPPPMKTDEQPSAKKPRKDDDERVQRAAQLMIKSPILTVPQAMLCNDFTNEETKDRALQQRVRRLHSNIKKGIVNPDSLLDIEKEFEERIPLGMKACEFLTKSTDPFLAVKSSSDVLDAAGFVKLSKREPFGGKLVPGGSYYYTINHSTLVAFTVGAKFKPGNGFKIIGGHTDSPHLKVKPMSKRVASGCVQLGVECYGGGLWHTWFDRDLGISGRVLVRTIDPETQKEKIEQHLVRIHKPLARVSTLCIHLQSREEMGAFKVNKEEHLSPILGTSTLLEAAAAKQLNQFGEEDDAWKKGQEPALLKLIASELGIETKQIANFELGLFDCQPASLGGIKNEFLYSARLDNLATVFVSLEAIVDYSKSEDVAEDDMISLIACFDHEEIGSDSTHGAGSPVMSEAVERITSAFSDNTHSRDPETHASAIRKSFIFSVDQAHALHPNYPSKHEKNHAPMMNAGVVIKTNQNQRYATNGVTGFIARELAKKGWDGTKVPIQEFCVRSDCPCGSTIGPILSANTGIRAVDLGMPQLSMHSCREVMGVADLTHGLNLFKSFFKYFNEVDECLEG
eukprot:CAMPEP_0172307440 /NCGR_PEP_ID=MMETSP1058-20130122/8301_1 /TAXON_ID=83371 /ORGANISM="Detonula confervacea, Strain CCMP 353" /LENGTH=575 /DNA_ID=CAMNT_0013019611 /DNA_START=68 /DNA_END=1795 /DNA_ORIENTATION=-